MKKKRTIKHMAVLCLCAALNLSACGMYSAEKPGNSSSVADRMEKIETMRSHKARQAAKAEQEDSEEQKKVVFGSESAAGYRDFEYLTEQIVSVTGSGSGKETDYSVYVPESKYSAVYGALARGESAGVYVGVNFEPDLLTKTETHSVRGDLKRYIDEMITYYSDCYNIDVSKIENIGKNAAVCEVDYIKYDFYEDTYTPYYEVYGLYDLGDDVTALVIVVIDADHTTEETREMLDELSSFYQFDIHWDESFAQAKIDKFNDSNSKIRKYENNRHAGSHTGNTYDMELITFMLPEIWEIDEELSDEEYGMLAFIPDDGREEAETYFFVMETGEAFGMVELWLEDIEELEALYEEEFEDCEVNIEDIGLTFLGRTVETKITIYDEEWESVNFIYLAEDDEYSYMLSAGYEPSGDAEKDAELEAEIQEALDVFFETGYVKGGL